VPGVFAAALELILRVCRVHAPLSPFLRDFPVTSLLKAAKQYPPDWKCKMKKRVRVQHCERWKGKGWAGSREKPWIWRDSCATKAGVSSVNSRVLE